MTLLFPPFVLTHSIAQTDFWMYNFHLVHFSNNNEQKWQNVWLIQMFQHTFTASPKVHSISCPPRYLVLRSQKWSRHNRNNFNTHFIDSKPCKSMHLVKLKLIQGNIIPIRIFHQCCKSSNEPSSTIMVMHCGTAALQHTLCKFTLILSTFHTLNTLLDLSLFYSQTSGYNGDCSFHGRDGLKATIWGTWVNFSDMVTGDMD